MGKAERDTAEAALQRILKPLAACARTAGVKRDRFVALATQAFRPPASTGGARGAEALPYEVGVRLVGRWLREPAYSRRGRPRVLPLSGPRSFASLVRAARGGPVADALAALEATGVVRVARGRVRLLQPAYLPRAGSPEQIEAAGIAGADFLKLASHNLGTVGEERLLQRAASYDNIGANAVKALEKRLRREGERALERADRILGACDRDRNPRAPRGRRTRVAFGVYVWREPASRPKRRGRR